MTTQKIMDDKGSRRAPAFRDHLNEEEKRQIRELVELCNSHDHTSYSSPLDADMYLWRADPSGEGILGLLCIWHLGATTDGLDTDEVAAFTAPGSRGRGIFRELFSEASLVLRPAVLFSVYENASALKALAALGAELYHSEYMMVRELKPEDGARAPEAPPMDSEGRISTNFGEAYIRDIGGRAYIYGVLVYERFRGRGMGRRLLSEVLRQAADMGFSQAFLEVASDNLPAIRLYESSGFSLEERLDLYIKKLSKDS